MWYCILDSSSGLLCLIAGSPLKNVLVTLVYTPEFPGNISEIFQFGHLKPFRIAHPAAFDLMSVALQ